MEHSRVLIFGAGTIGIYLGAKLHKLAEKDGGLMVEIFGRHKLSELKGATINIKEQGKSTKYQLPPHAQSFDQMSYDIVFVTTKLYDATAAMQIIKDTIKTRLVVFIQNGLVPDKFYEKIKQGGIEFIAMSVFEGYQLVGDELRAGPARLGWQLDNSFTSEIVGSLLKKAGINVNYNEDLRRARAEKMLINTGINAMSALLQKTVGELMDEAELQQQVDALIREGYEVLMSHGYSLTPLEEFLEACHKLYRENSGHYSSTCQDIVAGKKSEIRFINGLIVSLGREHSIPVPHNERIVREIEALESKVVKRSKK